MKQLKQPWTQHWQLLFESSYLEHSCIRSANYNVNNQFIGLRQKLWFHCAEMKQLKQLFFRLITRMFWHSRQPIQPVFHNNINRFMYFPQQRLLQCFLFRIRSHICLLHNTTNTRRITQSTLQPTECRIFGMFDPFRTFHPSLHESVALMISIYIK